MVSLFFEDLSGLEVAGLVWRAGGNFISLVAVETLQEQGWRLCSKRAHRKVAAAYSASSFCLCSSNLINAFSQSVSLTTLVVVVLVAFCSAKINFNSNSGVLSLNLNLNLILNLNPIQVEKRERGRALECARRMRKRKSERWMLPGES